MEKLILTPITGYTVYSSDSDRTGSRKGLYKHYEYACQKSKGSGWYGSDGEVHEINLWEDEEHNLYEVELRGKFQDVEETYKEEIIKQIKSKLTKEELTILGL